MNQLRLREISQRVTHLGLHPADTDPEIVLSDALSDRLELIEAVSEANEELRRTRQERDRDQQELVSLRRHLDDLRTQLILAHIEPVW